ncbi:MAG: Transcriptional regulator, partial [Massilia sp.]|nr:Transcriptional regulator [Massilia sp.]
MEQELNVQRSATPSPVMAANDSAAAGALAPAPVRVSGPVALRQFRMSKRESQATFWARFVVTQSSGSR